jgi:hypothetical protein
VRPISPDLESTRDLLELMARRLGRCVHQAAALSDVDGAAWALSVELSWLIAVVEVLVDRHHFSPDQN